MKVYQRVLVLAVIFLLGCGAEKYNEKVDLVEKNSLKLHSSDELSNLMSDQVLSDISFMVKIRLIKSWSNMIPRYEMLYEKSRDQFYQCWIKCDEKKEIYEDTLQKYTKLINSYNDLFYLIDGQVDMSKDIVSSIKMTSQCDVTPTGLQKSNGDILAEIFGNGFDCKLHIPFLISWEKYKRKNILFNVIYDIDVEEDISLNDLKRGELGLDEFLYLKAVTTA